MSVSSCTSCSTPTPAEYAEKLRTQKEAAKPPVQQEAVNALPIDPSKILDIRT